MIFDRTHEPTRMRIISNEKYNYAIRLKFVGTFVTFSTKIVLQVKASTCSTIKENLLLYCRRFFGICCYCFYNLTYFNNKVCITKKHHF